MLQWLVDYNLLHNPLNTKADLVHQPKNNTDKEIFEVDDIQPLILATLLNLDYYIGSMSKFFCALQLYFESCFCQNMSFFFFQDPSQMLHLNCFNSLVLAEAMHSFLSVLLFLSFSISSKHNVYLLCRVSLLGHHINPQCIHS